MFSKVNLQKLIKLMVLRAWDHQKTIQHIDFMYINGLIIIYHRFLKRKSFNLFCLRREKSIFFAFSSPLFCLRRQKSIFVAFSSPLFCLRRQKSRFFCIFRLQNAKNVFFLVVATALGPSSKDAPRKSVLTALKIIEIQNGKLSVVKKQ